MDSVTEKWYEYDSLNRCTSEKDNKNNYIEFVYKDDETCVGFKISEDGKRIQEASDYNCLYTLEVHSKN